MREPRMIGAEGPRLSRIGPDLWSAERDLKLAGNLEVPARMTVLRDAQRRLLCYSPVQIDEGTREALEGLGSVHWLAVPNRFQSGFLSHARAVYPHAQVLVAQGVAADGAQPLSGSGAVSGMADYHLVRASQRFSELALYHDPSEALILSDLMLNVSAGRRRLRWLLRLDGAWGRPSRGRLQNLLFLRDPKGLAAFYEWAMARPFRQIVVAHGGIVRERAREVFYRLFRPSSRG